MAFDVSVFRQSFAAETKELVRFNNSPVATLHLLYEAELVYAERFHRDKGSSSNKAVPELWIKFIGFSRRLQKLYPHTFHCWLSCLLDQGEYIADFGKIYEAFTGEKVTGYMSEDVALVFAQRLVSTIKESEIYAQVQFSMFQPGQKYRAGRSIISIKLSDKTPHEKLTRAACDLDKSLTWTLHDELVNKSHYFIFRDQNSMRELGTHAHGYEEPSVDEESPVEDEPPPYQEDDDE